MITASVPDFREAARRRVPRFLFEHFDGGPYADATLRRNVEDLASLALRRRVVRDASDAVGERLAMIADWGAASASMSLGCWHSVPGAGFSAAPGRWGPAAKPAC